jgi:hypothetical protein
MTLTSHRPRSQAGAAPVDDPFRGEPVEDFAHAVPRATTRKPVNLAAGELSVDAGEDDEERRRRASPSQSRTAAGSMLPN